MTDRMEAAKTAVAADYESFGKNDVTEGGQHFRNSAILEFGKAASEMPPRFQEHEQHPAIPQLALVNASQPVYSLAAAAHGSTYGQCLRAVRAALADPRQNTKNVHRSAQWISNRCAVAESNHNRFIREHTHNTPSPGRENGSSGGRSSSNSEAERQARDARYRQDRETEAKREQARYEQRRQEQIRRDSECAHYHANSHLNLPKPNGCN